MFASKERINYHLDFQESNFVFPEVAPGISNQSYFRRTSKFFLHIESKSQGLNPCSRAHARRAFKSFGKHFPPNPLSSSGPRTSRLRPIRESSKTRFLTKL